MSSRRNRPHRPALGEHVPGWDVLARVLTVPLGDDAGALEDALADARRGLHQLHLRAVMRRPRVLEYPATHDGRSTRSGGRMGGARPPAYSDSHDDKPGRGHRMAISDFLSENGDRPLAFTATGEIGLVHGAAYTEDAFSYTLGAIWLHTPHLQILRNGRVMRLNGPGELLTKLLPPSHMTSVLSTGG